MGNLISQFGHGHSSKHVSKPKPKDNSAITDVDRAVLSLKTQRKRLEDQQKLLEQRIERYAEVARALIKEAKKDRALLALRKKKMSENQLTHLQQLLINVEDTLSNMELARQQNKLFAVLQQGNEALKQLQKEVTLEDAKQLMDDTADAKAYQDEMNSILAQTLSGEDDQAAVEELEVLEAMQLAADTAAMPRVPQAAMQVAAPEGSRSKEALAASAADQERDSEEEEDADVADSRGRQREEPLAAS